MTVCGAQARTATENAASRGGAEGDVSCTWAQAPPHPAPPDAPTPGRLRQSGHRRGPLLQSLVVEIHRRGVQVGVRSALVALSALHACPNTRKSTCLVVQS